MDIPDAERAGVTGFGAWRRMRLRSGLADAGLADAGQWRCPRR